MTGVCASDFCVTFLRFLRPRPGVLPLVRYPNRCDHPVTQFSSRTAKPGDPPPDLARRTAVVALSGLCLVPLLIGLGASNSDPVELESLRLANESLKIENDSYRSATGELADQISSLQSALTQLGTQAELDPAAKARHGAPARRDSVAGGGRRARRR